MASGPLPVPAPPRARSLDSLLRIHSATLVESLRFTPASCVLVCGPAHHRGEAVQRERQTSLKDIVSDALVEHGEESHRLLEARARVLTQALDVCLQVEGDIGLWWVEFAHELSEEFKAVLFSRLSQLFAQYFVQTGHPETVQRLS